MASRKIDYDKEIRKLQAELKKRRKQHKKVSDVKNEIERLKRLKASKKKVTKKKASKKKAAKKKKRGKKKEVFDTPEPPPPPPPPEPEPEPEPEVPGAPVFHREIGDSRGYSDPRQIIKEERFLHSTQGNRNVPDETKIVRILQNKLLRAIEHNHLELDDVRVYRPGILFRPNTGNYTEFVEKAVQDALSHLPGASFYVIEEGKTFSLRINLTDTNTPLSYNETRDIMEDETETIRKIYDILHDLYDDVNWFETYEVDVDLEDSD